MFCALEDTALIGVSGPDAASFLHAQLTSEVLSLAPLRTQYSGHCSPKGRLLGTFLLWRLENEIVLQLPASIAAAMRARLQKYVLRSRVTLTDVSERFRIFGFVAKNGEAASAFGQAAPAIPHEVNVRGGLTITSLGSHRYVILETTRDHGSAPLANGLDEPLAPADAWRRSEIAAGVSWITPPTQDQFVPQMVNLDLIGGVSFSKGCYPGQEIVARTHYLGRLKQRLYRVRFTSAAAPRPGDPLLSPRFGAEQSCGMIVNVVDGPGGAHEALVAVQIESARDRDVHWRDLSGPMLEFLPLPYAVPE